MNLWFDIADFLLRTPAGCGVGWVNRKMNEWIVWFSMNYGY